MVSRSRGVVKPCWQSGFAGVVVRRWHGDVAPVAVVRPLLLGSFLSLPCFFFFTGGGGERGKVSSGPSG